MSNLLSKINRTGYHFKDVYKTNEFMIFVYKINDLS